MAVDCIGPVLPQSVDHLNRIFQLSTHDFNISNYTQAVTASKRTGHARFRRGPSPSSTDANGPSTSSGSEDKPQDSTSTSSSSSVVSSSAGGSVSNGKQFSSLGIVAPAPTFSSRKPPLPSTHRKRCRADRPDASVHRSGSDNHSVSVSRSGCHCCKRRKTGSKRQVRRVPIIGSKVTGIPADDYSWKKYGEKKIDGSPYARVYYKCITGKGCPARKSVELDVNDLKMLIVTYDGEHRHRHAPTLVPTSLTGLSFESK